MGRPENLRNVRVDDDIWVPAGERATAEGTNLSAVIRDFLADYAVGADLRRRGGGVKLTAAEQKRARAKLAKTLDLDAVLSSVVDAINGQ